MNLEESELFSNELAKNNKQKKAVLMIIVVLAIILVFLIAAVAMVANNEANRFKTYYNGKEVSFPKGFMIQADNGEYYINIKMMAEEEGYTYNPGEYKKYEETEESCNVSKDLEVTSLMAGKNYFYKTIDKSTASEFTILPYGSTSERDTLKFIATAANGSVETFETEVPVELVDGELYAPLDTIRDVFNVRIVQGENEIEIESLSYVYAKVSAGIVKKGYTTISGDFEDLKALVYGLAVVINGTNQGVISTINYEPVISAQYSELQFIQNSQEFFASATGSNNMKTVGLISAEGKTIIKPTQYEEISVLSDKNGLYLVKSGKQYGVLNRNGEIVVYVQYDKIGLNNMSDFPLEDSTNASVLFEKFIPVISDGKYGLYNIDGLETLKPVYDSLGYITLEENTRELNVLSIPAEVGIKGLVVKLNDYYGIYDMTTESLCIPCVFEKIYAETKNNVTTYYLQEPNSTPVSLELFIESNGLRNVDAEGNPLQSSQDNTQSYVTNGETVEELNPGNESTEPVINLNGEEVVEEPVENGDEYLE